MLIRMSMKSLTQRQRDVLGFIRSHQENQGVPPTLREIAEYFGFRSMTAAADHVRALRKKGHLSHDPRRARAYRVLSPVRQPSEQPIRVPVFGSITAGFPEEREQEVIDWINLDAQALRLDPHARLFALRVRGDSMVDRHIIEGDQVILERDRSPRPGDVVADLVDNESTLKTFRIEQGRAVLCAENSKYPAFVPATHLVIQGVMVGLVRRGS
jgi:repressor LexA